MCSSVSMMQGGVGYVLCSVRMMWGGAGYNDIIIDYLWRPSRKSPERLQRHKDTLVTHTHTHTQTHVHTTHTHTV